VERAIALERTAIEDFARATNHRQRPKKRRR
jgi:hypothetical protein